MDPRGGQHPLSGKRAELFPPAAGQSGGPHHQGPAGGSGHQCALPLPGRGVVRDGGHRCRGLCRLPDLHPLGAQQRAGLPPSPGAGGPELLPGAAGWAFAGDRRGRAGGGGHRPPAGGGRGPRRRRPGGRQPVLRPVGPLRREPGGEKAPRSPPGVRTVGDRLPPPRLPGEHGGPGRGGHAGPPCRGQDAPRQHGPVSSGGAPRQPPQGPAGGAGPADEPPGWRGPTSFTGSSWKTALSPPSFWRSYPIFPR